MSVEDRLTEGVISAKLAVRERKAADQCDMAASLHSRVGQYPVPTQDVRQCNHTPIASTGVGEGEVLGMINEHIVHTGTTSSWG